ncbi:hypothetical protein RB195_021967 [Necator americanus]|uniref:Uncharacterized protein n=1 Tax=Necator americanus TaxID=51031 RepID=A0ABR1EE36_NECAM
MIFWNLCQFFCRFFFNLGVQYSRSLAATQLYQEKLAHVAVSSAAANVPTQANLSHVLQLAGVLSAETQVGVPRTMDQYLSQLGIAGSQAHALLRQAQSHHLAQQAQLLAAAASVRLPDRSHPSYSNSVIPLHADLLQMAAQCPISASASVQSGQLIRQPLFSSGNASNVAATSYSAASSINPHKQIPPNTAAAEQQAYYLQQALSAVTTGQNEKPEVDVHVLQQQGSVGLHQYVSPTTGEVLKPVAVGGGSQDAALSPRPPPVDPSPPRAPADVGTNVIDSNPSTFVHQQAQTSPPVPRDQCIQGRTASQVISAGRPQSARENGSSSNFVGSRTTPQNSAPATPALTADDVVPVSQTLFQVSEQHFTEAFNASRKKSVSNPIGIAKCDIVSSAEEGASKVSAEPSTITAPVHGGDRKDLDDKPALAPILMMTYLSNCMSNIKSTLNTNGLPIGLDANGRAVDYSSRPIDPIFQQARARMENAREFRELSPPTTLPQVPRSSFEDGSGFSPIGVALPAVSSAVSRSQVTNPVGVNRIVPDASSLEKNEENHDTDPPAEKRTKIISDGD